MSFPWRALFISVVLSVVSAFWLSYTEMYFRSSSFAVSAPIPLPAIAALLLLLVVKGVLSLLKEAWTLSRQEILLVYCFLIISVPLASYGLAQQLIPHITAPFFYGDEKNEVIDLLKHIPSWAHPDMDAIRGMYLGSPDGIPWRSWLVPFAGWAVLLFLIYGFCLCLSILISDQWMKAERLRFPLIVPALELTDESGSGLLLKPLVKDVVFWLGVGGATVFNGLRILHQIDSDFPAPNWMWTFTFPNKPWNGMGTIYMYYKPLVLGMAYLAPTSLSLSVWVFQCWKYLQGAFGELAGVSHLTGSNLTLWSVGRFPFHNEQALGAFAFIALFSLYKARRQLFSLFSSDRSQLDDARAKGAAFIGCCVCMIGGLIWCFAAGYSVWLAIGLAAVMLLITITHSRIRAEAGPPSFFLGPYRPNDMIVTTLGTKHFGAADMTQLGTLGFITKGYFPFLMATQLETLKIARDGGIKRVHMIAILICALVVGMAAGLTSTLHVWYKIGADAHRYYPINGGLQTYESVVHYLKHSSEFNYLGTGFMGIGFTLAGILTLCRTQFWWWPLHPLGYAVAETWQSHQIWFMFLIAWAIKSAVLRYGGITLYKRTIPIFIGLIVGQIIAVLVACLLNAYGFKIYVTGT